MNHLRKTLVSLTLALILLIPSAVFAENETFRDGTALETVPETIGPNDAAGEKPAPDPLLYPQDDNRTAARGKTPIDEDPESTRADVFDTTALGIGTNTFQIKDAGETLYLPFSPQRSGNYLFYSMTEETGGDPVGYLLDGNKNQLTNNDDGASNNNFVFQYSLNAGSTYYVGARFFNATQTGTIYVRIDRYTESSESLALGNNAFPIETAGDVVYRPFTPSVTGVYHFYTLGIADTVGYLKNSVRETIYWDDDSGSGSNFNFFYTLEAGNTYYFGAGFYGQNYSGTIYVGVERLTYYDTPLALGNNSFTTTAQGEYQYRPFTPSKTSTYRVYSTGTTHVCGCLKNAYFETTQGWYYTDTNFDFTCDLEAGQTYYIGVCHYYTADVGTINVVIRDTSEPEFTFTWNSSDVQYKGTTPYVIANGSAQTPRFTVKDADGNTLSSSDYDCQYRENTNAGTGYVTLTFKGAYSGTLTKWFKIYLPATTETTVQNVGDGIKLTWKAVSGAAGYVIYRRAWSSTTNGWTDFVRWNNTTELNWTDTKVYAGTRYQYGIKAYFARRTDPVSGATIGGNVGDNYNLGIVGPLKTTVRITTRTLTQLTAGSRKITVNWKGSRVFTGYQIKYATDSGFTKNVKSVWVNNASTYSTTLTSLTNGTRYYVCVRSYHDFEGTRYYGQWSNVLNIKAGTEAIVDNKVYRALFAGESSYESPNDPLPGSNVDAQAMAGAVEQISNRFSCLVYEDASRNEIINTIRYYANKSTEDDVFLFMFAGHGAGNTQGTSAVQGALCLIDGSRITTAELAEELSKVNGRVIVFLNCCFSGTAIGKGVGSDAVGADELDAFNQSVIDAFSGYEMDGTRSTRAGELANSKFIVLTAAAGNQYGWHGSFYGPFSGKYYPQHALNAAIMKGIGATYPNGNYSGSMPADTNKDKLITLKELYTYAYNNVYNWTKNLDGGPARVQYYGPENEVIFRRK